MKTLVTLLLFLSACQYDQTGKSVNALGEIRCCLDCGASVGCQFVTAASECYPLGLTLCSNNTPDLASADLTSSSNVVCCPISNGPVPFQCTVPVGSCMAYKAVGCPSGVYPIIGPNNGAIYYTCCIF